MTTAPDRRKYQFSLRTLLELTTVACIAFSLWTWGGEPISHTPEFFAALAVFLVASGIFARRATWVLGGAVVAVGLFCVLAVHRDQAVYESEHTWNRESLSLTMIDVQSRLPVSGAKVKITSGKPSARKTSENITSSDGTITMEVMRAYDHWALEGTDREIEIEVSAPGYKKCNCSLLDCRDGKTILIDSAQ
jgi:hypothetical protein